MAVARGVAAPAGKVWLVGAGPGDPGLLTVKGRRVLSAAEAVVYDRLANPALLVGLRVDCERVYVGKEPGSAAMTQATINETLVRLAKAGKSVVRLKGGDPFVFGRGGEEAGALRASGVPFEIVPGVSSAIAAPAYAGIPVTHRGIASSFAVVTGHEESDKPESAIDWTHLAGGVDTIVCLMTVSGLPEITTRLIAAGRPPGTPAAVVSWGTMPNQRTISGRLDAIAALAQAAALVAPAVTIIGEVVRLRETLEWFEARPLFGKKVLITRTRQQSSGLRSLLEDEGAEVIELPTLEIVDGASPQLLDRVVEALADGEYAWVVFTSANAVRRFFQHVHETGRDARAFHVSKVAAIGPGTAAALAEYGIRADVIPPEYVGESLAEALSGQDLVRRRVLIPRAESARPELVSALRAHGAEVEEVPLYRSELPRNPDAAILAQIGSGQIDFVTFASSSAVRNLVKMLGDDTRGLQRATIGCIGPITAETAERCGLHVSFVAEDHTVPGLVEAMRQHVAGAASGA